LRHSLYPTLIAIFICCATAWADSPPLIRQPESVPTGRTLTLDDCIKLALRNQSAIRQATAQVEIQKGQLMQAKSKLLPSTSVTTSTELAGTGGGNGSSLDTSASQLIYDFGKTPAGVAQATHQESASQHALVQSTSDTILSVKTAYYSLLQDRHLVDVYAEQLKDQQGHLSQAQARKAVGTVPLADVLQAQAAVSSAQFDLVTARKTAELARVTLNTAMGINVQVPLTIAEITEPAPLSMDEDQLVKLALLQRPEVRQNMELVLANQALVTVARTTNLPSVDTSVARSETFGDYSGASGGTDWLWSVNLSWSPIDFGNTAGAIRSAKGGVITAEEALYNAKQNVTQDVVQARLSVIDAEAQMNSANDEVASAKENLSVATGQYDAGVGILLNVLDAQAALLKADVDQFTAQYGLSTARAQLTHAIGTIPGPADIR
jgi:outer membrane protein TolC